MPRTVTLHQLKDLAHSAKNEILLDTSLHTELHIIAQKGRTIIKLPYGNKFDIVNGEIIIYDNGEIIIYD